MRLWSLHPQYLDTKGLVALWREALLARAVLRGETRGYHHHPQLTRFMSAPQPLVAMAVYLHAIHAEATSRGYAFNPEKVGKVVPCDPIPVSSGQLSYELQHLLAKLAIRDPELQEKWSNLSSIESHPLFSVYPGEPEPWERRHSGHIGQPGAQGSGT